MGFRKISLSLSKVWEILCRIKRCLPKFSIGDPPRDFLARPSTCTVIIKDRRLQSFKLLRIIFLEDSRRFLGLLLEIGNWILIWSHFYSLLTDNLSSFLIIIIRTQLYIITPPLGLNLVAIV